MYNYTDDYRQQQTERCEECTTIQTTTDNNKQGGVKNV